MEVILRVKTIPNASRNELVGWIGNVCKIKLQAAPEKGKANEALCAFLAEILELKKSQVEIKSGKCSREKKIKVKGLNSELLFKKLEIIKAG